MPYNRSMISKYTYKKLTWIDLEKPTNQEVLSLIDEYRLPELFVQELLTPIPRAKVDKYGDFISLVLHFPILTKSVVLDSAQEVDFIIGKNFIITAHEGSVNALYEFSKLFEIDLALNKNIASDHAGHLFYFMIREMYRHTLLELETVNSSIHSIEKALFSGHEHDCVGDISNLNRTLVDFKQALRFHRETLSSFDRASVDFFGTEFSYYMSAIIGEFNKVEQTLIGEKETLSDLRETNESLIASKTNDVMRKLTIMNFIMLPLGLITWIFAMHTNTVYIKDDSDFILVLGGMAFIALAMYLYFKAKKWF